MPVKRHFFLSALTLTVGLVAILGSSYGLHLLPAYPQWHYLTPFIIVLAALPTYIIFVKIGGLKKGLLWLTLLSLFGLGLETTAVATGWPYGFFRYEEWLGAQVFGLVPWTVAFAWPPLVLGSVLLTRLVTRRWWDFLVSTSILVWFDLVFDPGAVTLGFWHWLKPGSYYGVPMINFFGWIVSGLIATFVVTRWLRQVPEQPMLLRSGAICFWVSVCFWTALAGWQQLWVPLLLGICLSLWVGLRLTLPPAQPPIEPKLDKLVPPRPERYYRQRKTG